MTATMGKLWRSMLVAAGLMLAGVGTAGAQVPATAPVGSATAPAKGVSGVPGASNLAPTTAGATPPAAPTSPLLAVDGSPGLSKPTPGMGQPVDGAYTLQPQVTKNGNFAHRFHDTILFPMTVIISLLVLGLLVWVVLRYRQSVHPIPSKTSHNTTIEVIWTLAPVVALVAIAVPSIGLLQAQFKPAPAGAVTLKAIGNQWYWSYQYPDNGGFEITANMLKEKDQVGAGERARTDADGPRLLAADNRVVLPVGVPIRLITTANDVIHSWAMPAFWIKLDAVPGRLNETSFTIEKPGVYFGQCSELCGARHAFMPITVEAVPSAVFAAWVRAKGGTMPAGPAKPSTKVIPQPGADNQPDANAKAAAAALGSNASTAEPDGNAATVMTQHATANGPGAGHGGQ